jgi:hypothetical protein
LLASAALCEGAVFVEQAGVGGSFAVFMVAVAELDPRTSQLEGFEASNPAWADAYGVSNNRCRQKAGILYFKLLPFRMHLDLRFRTVTVRGEFVHLARGNWRDVYYCSQLGLTVKILPSEYHAQSMSEFEQRRHFHGCVAPQYGCCTGELFDTSMHLLVAAYVGASLHSRLQNIIWAEPIAAGLPIIMAHLKQVS